jgi:hypothetical protein
VFGNGVLRRICGPKGQKLTEGWSFIICTLLLNIIRAVKSRKMKWRGHVECVDETINAFKILDGKSKGKRQNNWRSVLSVISERVLKK